MTYYPNTGHRQFSVGDPESNNGLKSLTCNIFWTDISIL